MRTLFRLFSALLFIFITIGAVAQTKKINEVPDFKYGINPDYSLLQHKSNALSRNFSFNGKEVPTGRPDHWNNATLKFFPPIFNQDGPSCMGSSYVGYIFTNETNSLRNADGSQEENQYAVFFNWLLTNFNSSKENMLIHVGNPNAVTYNGRTYSSKFGYQDWSTNEWGWMQGYDKWFAAMHNRVSRTASFPISVATEEGREAVKNWLWNHNGDTDFYGGGVCYVTVASSMKNSTIKYTPANSAAGVVGKKYVTCWGKSMDHALTIVGYDDRLEFDLDSNGVYGEKDKDEVGAWILVNSWGSGWENGGWIYVPYKHGGVTFHAENDPWRPEVMYARKNYRPLRTLKILMDFSDRRKMLLAAGVSADTSAVAPESSTELQHFRYAGSSEDTVEAVPMLGKWIDGMHYEPMEFGYDLTDLSASFDRTQPLKYFFIINTKKADVSGHVYRCSLIDYEFDREGVEVPFTVDTIDVPGLGKTTMISVVVAGEKINPPLNLSYTKGAKSFSWSAPETTSLELLKYYIYRNGVCIDSVAPTSHSYSMMGGSYTVSACYANGKTMVESAQTQPLVIYEKDEEEQGDNQVYVFKHGGFTIENLLPNILPQATIEFWFKPYSTTNYNQQIGPGWGKFLMHATSDGAIFYGWSTAEGNRYSGTNKVLTNNTWQHVALTIDKNVMTLYINGTRKSSFKGRSYSGLSGIGSLVFGSNNQPLNGEIDELRIWSKCRTNYEIMKNMRVELVNYKLLPDLLAYYRMDTIEEDGQTKLRDRAHGHHATFLDEDVAQAKIVKTLMRGSITLAAEYDLLAGPYIAGQGIKATPRLVSNVVGWKWTAVDAGVKDLYCQSPTFVFPKAGEFPITLTVADADGNTVEQTKTITVNAAPEPIIDFDIAQSSLPAGDHFSFINKSQAVGASYVWSLPGAEVEQVRGTHAGGVYVETGIHKVTLTATTPSGKKSVTKEITVTNSSPKVDFYVHPRAVIKGEKVYLNDKSRYQPTKWFWKIDNNRNTVAVIGQNSSYTTTAPGYYNVSLTATNDIGTNTLREPSVFIVSNADSKTGLRFGGDGNLVTFSNPFSAAPRSFTVDWWMKPENFSRAFYLCSGDETFVIKSNAEGGFEVSGNNRKVVSSPDLIILNEWHHYSLVCSTGHIIIYRDGEKIDTPSKTSLGLAALQFSGDFHLGAVINGMTSIIDEFRIFESSLSPTNVQNYCNQPIENVDSVQTANKLRLYYNFNQDSGSPTDLTSNHFDSQRTGFGPDGDAWTSSLGVFTLNFDQIAEIEDVSITYLTNYKRPFRRTSTSVNPKEQPTRFLELETGTARSTWVLKNEVEEDGVITGAHVDTQKSYDLVVETKWTGFANTLNNHILYQTVELPAGTYVFTASPDYNAGGFTADKCYVVATLADTLASMAQIDNTLAKANLTDESVEFSITETSKVSLGIIYNMSGYCTAPISNFKLERLPLNVFEGDGLTSIRDAVKKGKREAISAEVGGVRIVSDEIIPVRIFNSAGQCIFNEFVSGSKHIALPRGTYIVNGVKIGVIR